MIRSISICQYIKNRSNRSENNSENNMKNNMENNTENDILIDLRDKHTFEFGTIEGAINIPLDDISRLYDLPKDKDIYLFCQTGEISEEIAMLLSDAGYNACNLTGGFREYFKKSFG